ncbi:Uncharacterised protein [Mycobacteroides abscessus subsp. massiliense]|nr:Uncharacterised protein [Mycobacteroides abscessus subsp. massiliense]
MHGLHDRDHRWELGQYARHQDIDLVDVHHHAVHVFGDLIDAVEGVEYGARRPADGDVGAVFFPVEVVSDRPEEVVERIHQVTHVVHLALHFLHLTGHVVHDVREFAHHAVHPFHGSDQDSHLVRHGQHVCHAILHVFHVLDLTGPLQTDLERN